MNARARGAMSVRRLRHKRQAGKTTIDVVGGDALLFGITTASHRVAAARLPHHYYALREERRWPRSCHIYVNIFHMLLFVITFDNWL